MNVTVDERFNTSVGSYFPSGHNVVQIVERAICVIARLNVSDPLSSLIDFHNDRAEDVVELSTEASLRRRVHRTCNCTSRDVDLSLALLVCRYRLK